MGQRSFFDVENRLQSVSKMGKPLERLAAVMPWESFRPMLWKVCEKEHKSNTGRKPLDVVLMFKVLTLRSLYNLADKQVEYQIRDRLSFTRFLGLGIEDELPDATTVWRFRERLKELGLIEKLFDRFGDHLTAEGFQAKQWQMVDASIVPVPCALWADPENPPATQTEIMFKHIDSIAQMLGNVDHLGYGSGYMPDPTKTADLALANPNVYPDRGGMPKGATLNGIQKGGEHGNA